MTKICFLISLQTDRTNNAAKRGAKNLRQGRYMSRHLFLANLAIFVVADDRGQEIISRGFGSEAPASRHQQSVPLMFAGTARLDD